MRLAENPSAEPRASRAAPDPRLSVRQLIRLHCPLLSFPEF